MNKDIEMLLKLKADANDVIKDLHQEAFHEAINWKSLSAVDTEKALNSHGDLFYRVWIEEASPDARDLQEAVYDELTERGWKYIEVQTQW